MGGKLGEEVGRRVGGALGRDVGRMVGEDVGALVGRIGFCVGANVGPAEREFTVPRETTRDFIFP